MAIFKAPRITTLQRLALVLQASEIVYDLDTKSFWGGNGTTLGGFPLGAGATFSEFELITITQDNLDTKSIELSKAPLAAQFLILEVINGITQLFEQDYTFTGNILSWDGLGLDNFLEIGDILLIKYLPFIGGLTGGGYELIQLTLTDINNKFVGLEIIPSSPESVKLTIIGGTTQLYSVDYIIGGNILSWNGKGLDGFLEVDDYLLIEY